MGVRGLTTFIAQNSDRYLKRCLLHDTYLVIDGNNLAAQLYKWHAKCYDCFGGDYDKYAQSILHFFNVLRECNVTPLIVFDGSYEDKKLKTVYSRMKARMIQAKRSNPSTENSITVFPLFLREVFLGMILKLNLKVVRCLVEADFEMACISRKLKCPVLSYDSDFYIFDVEYIPFNTLRLRSVTSSGKDCYKYLDCQVYKVENFLKAYGGLQKNCVPLLGVLLGNDYIRISVFSNFYKHLKRTKNKPGSSDQQRRIKSLIAWLQEESFDSALRKILGRTKEVYRKKVTKQIISTINNYICSESGLLKYLNLDIIQNDVLPPRINIDIDNINNIEIEDFHKSEDEDDGSLVDSESETEELLDDVNEELELPALLKHFEEKYKKCQYPACFIDIMINNRYFFVPIVEDYYKPQCHNISLTILAAISAILQGNRSEKLKYILRNERGKLENFYLPKYTKSLPTLSGLENVSQKQSMHYLLSILVIDQGFFNKLYQFPSSWRLYITSVVYWIRNSNPGPNECHIYTLLLTAIILDSIGIEFSRNSLKFLKKYKEHIVQLECNPIKSILNDNSTVKDALTAITEGDKIMIMKELVPYFDMIIKIRRNPKSFDQGIVHIFAQFQSCAYHIQHLNSLLNNPLEDYLISNFYNGTFIYNLANNFLTRSQLDLYLQMLTRNSPNIYNAFVAIKNFIMAYVSDIGLKNIVSRKKRRKKKKVNETITDDESCCEDSGDDCTYDINNRFSILKMVNK